MKYLIEGIKLSGKSTLAELLWYRFKGSTMIEYRAYTEAQAPKYTINRDIIRRILNLANFIKLHDKEPFIIVRAHLFPFALAEATNQKIDVSFEYIDSFFSTQNVTLILLTVNEKTYFRRLKTRLRESREEYDWDKQWLNLNRMQSSYISLFKRSNMTKFRFDTSRNKLSILLTKLFDYCKK